MSRLKRWGLEPEVVITDGSSLYPAVLAELWPEAEHQLCVFHVIKDINEHVLDADQSEHQAYCRRAALVGNPAFQKVPELAKAMNMLEPKQFAKMIAFLKSPAEKRVRTNNHVERANRKLRHYEKVRYKWRRRRSMVRFLFLAIDRWWHERRCDGERSAPTPPKANRQQAKPRCQPKRRKRVRPPHSQLSG